ncbi:hypothetical protein ACQPW1_29155 [Nocardia sp. CA-128927]|uniref:hypothetical protein n=1 Tax=Nocardia sp. CA-128927 TaxID=3239975 RepID=UPI003D992335
MPDPTRTVAILCGASHWPRLDTFDPAPAFTNTATELRRYLTNPNGMALPAGNVLWLFDADTTAAEHIDRIDHFLAHHIQRTGSAHGRGLLILFAYVGHGAFFGADRAYCLLVRDTHKPGLAQTSLRVADLAYTLRTAAPESSRIVPDEPAPRLRTHPATPRPRTRRSTPARGPLPRPTHRRPRRHTPVPQPRHHATSTKPQPDDTPSRTSPESSAA